MHGELTDYNSISSVFRELSFRKGKALNPLPALLEFSESDDALTLDFMAAIIIPAAGAENRMCDGDALKPMQTRLAELNTKAYYLLVALSFLYTKNSTGRSLQAAISLTAIVAVTPLQDFFSHRGWYGSWLTFARWFKVTLLMAALFFALWWILCGAKPSVVNATALSLCCR